MLSIVITFPTVPATVNVVTVVVELSSNFIVFPASTLKSLNVLDPITFNSPVPLNQKLLNVLSDNTSI